MVSLLGLGMVVIMVEDMLEREQSNTTSEWILACKSG